MFNLTEKLSQVLAETVKQFSMQPALASATPIAKCDTCSGTCMGNCSGCYGCKGK